MLAGVVKRYEQEAATNQPSAAVAGVRAVVASVAVV